MSKRIIIVIAATLGVLLSIPAVANAGHQARFELSPDPPYYVGESITATDTSGSSGTIEWKCSGPEEYTQTGPSATCVYGTPGVKAIYQRVTEHGQMSENDITIDVYAQADRPFDTILASSSTVAVPDDLLAFRTPKEQLLPSCRTGSSQSCPTGVVKQEGPDASGLRTFYVQIGNAAMGPGTVITTEAYNDTANSPHDRNSFAITVASNRNDPFGLVQADFSVCGPHERKAGKLGVGAWVSYYLAQPHVYTFKVLIQRKVAQTGKWKRVKRVKSSGAGSDEGSPYYLVEAEKLIPQKPSALKKYKLRLKTKFRIPGVYKKSKTTRLKPSRC